MATSARNGRPESGCLSLADAMLQVTHLVWQAFGDASREYGLTPVQAELLCVLTVGSARMTELSRLLGIEKSSLTGLVDRAEQRGLVTRTRQPQDRRSYQIELTCDGARIALACQDEVTCRLEALARGLPASERSRLTSSMTALLAAHKTGQLQHGHGKTA